MHGNTRLCPTSRWLTWFDISPGKTPPALLLHLKLAPILCFLSVALVLMDHSFAVESQHASRIWLVVHPPLTNLHGTCAFLYNCDKIGAQLIVCLHLRAKQDLLQESSWDVWPHARKKWQWLIIPFTSTSRPPPAICDTWIGNVKDRPVSFILLLSQWPGYEIGEASAWSRGTAAEKVALLYKLQRTFRWSYFPFNDCTLERTLFSAL